ncbi:ankyrin repeat and SOCS box protein 3 [Nematostella vectensis]|uniref:ankyrin repeat and SOCS box protein 3 n=1 Tax=Nematostella vectensis TaxID=45351 RepID=UPI0020772594|nr:ankyrin repeat and SOCS box protein 3 [Nematostella vectensis]
MFPAFCSANKGLLTPRKAWDKHDCTEESEITWGRPRILLDAVSKGRLRQLRLLLDAGVNVNSRDELSGETALIRAVFLENAKLRRISLKMLVNYGAKVKITDKTGRSALSWACYHGREDVLRIFQGNPQLDLDLGSIDNQGNTNLILACMSGNAKIVTLIARAFRRNRFDVNRRNNAGESAMSLVRQLGYKDLVDVLLDVAHVNRGHVPQRPSLTSAGIKPVAGKRPKPHTAPKQRASCNLPKLFNLYTEQLTNSYPTRQCKSCIERR